MYIYIYNNNFVRWKTRHVGTSAHGEWRIDISAGLSSPISCWEVTGAEEGHGQLPQTLWGGVDGSIWLEICWDILRDAWGSCDCILGLVWSVWSGYIPAWKVVQEVETQRTAQWLICWDDGIVSSHLDGVTPGNMWTQWKAAAATTKEGHPTDTL